VGALYLLLCLAMLTLAMVAAHYERLSYQWRVWAVLFPPVVLAYVGLRRLRRRLQM
jgi:hypothetical protein